MVALAAPVPAAVAATPPPVTVGDAAPGAVANVVGDFVGLRGMRDDMRPPGAVHSDAVRSDAERLRYGDSCNGPVRLTKVLCLSHTRCYSQLVKAISKEEAQLPMSRTVGVIYSTIFNWFANGTRKVL